MSSMESAPATMPAMSAGTFSTAFTPPDPPTVSRVATRACRPQRWARAITGARPAHDTRFGSSKRTETAEPT